MFLNPGPVAFVANPAESTGPGSRPRPVERSVRPKPQRVPTVRRSVARPVLKRKVPTNREDAALNASGLYELGPRTYHMLKNELDYIMFTVEQDLPKVVDLSCEGERDIVDRWRNEMGDNLKDVLGLNVTKRLLNVFNPLNVKVHFTTKPDRKYLSTFLKRYNFVAFKRLPGVVNTFAAQVKTVADFDALCTAKSVHCGAAKITITPFYKFTQCPKKIKTNFCNQEHMQYGESNESSDKYEKTKDDSFTSIKSEDSAKTSKTDVTKEKPKTEPVVKPAATNDTVKVEEKKTEAKAPAQTSTKISAAKAEPPKPKVETPKPKVEAPKPKVEAPKPKVSTPTPKVEPPKPKVDTPAPKVEATKPKIVTPTPNAETPKPKVDTATPNAETPKPKAVSTTKAVSTAKAVATAKAQTSTPANAAPKPKVDTPKPKEETATTKVEPAKTKVENKPQIDTNKTKPQAPKAETKVEDKTKNTVKAVAQTKNTANVKTAPAKTVAKATDTSNTKTAKGTVTNKNVPVKKSVFPNKKATKKAIEKDDYEELDDHDILALISEGIVLDECSGSDEE